MTILSRVCAEFHDLQGNVICTITPANRFKPLEVPDAIARDPLFQLLVADHSLEAVVSAAQMKTLENDPVQGTNAEGKAPAPAQETNAEGKASASASASKAAPETKPAPEKKAK